MSIGTPTYEQQAQEEMTDAAAGADRRQFHPSADRKPSAKQVYLLARILLEGAGREWPSSAAAASALIDEMKGGPK